MEYDGRNQDEADYAAKLGKLSLAQQRRLKALMGWPPDPSKVPESFWLDVREETRKKQYLALYLIYIGSADWHARLTDEALDDDKQDVLDSRANDWAEREAARRADIWTERMRSRFGRLKDRLDVLRGPGEQPGQTATMTRDEFDDEIGKVIDAEDAAQAAATGTTAAQTAGGDAGIEVTVGLSDEDIWVNQPHLTRTGPCPRCESLDGLKRSEWGALYDEAAGGPPLHPVCACIIMYAAVPAAKK